MKLVTVYNRYTFTLMTIIFLLSGVASFFLLKEVFTREIDSQLHSVQKRIQNYVNVYHKIPEVSLVNDQKIVFQKTNNASKEALIKEVFVAYDYRKKPHISRQLSYSLVINGELYNVSITEPLEGTSHITGVIVKTNLSVIFIIFIGLILINRLVLFRLWKPFYQTVNEVSKFAVNQKNKLIFPKSKINEFNFMINTLEIATNKAIDNYSSLKEFTENASHEIQTPLAIIRSKLDLLVQHEGLSEIEAISLKSAYGAIKKLSRLSKDLLLLIKIENNEYETIENIDLKKKLEEKTNQFRELWQNGQIEISCNLSDSSIIASPNLIEILISNIFSNATKHNIPKGLIEVELTQKKLMILNTGQPLPLDQERIFERFYKGVKRTGNNGLGLSIVWEICEATGIKLSYDYINNKHGFIFEW